MKLVTFKIGDGAQRVGALLAGGALVLDFAAALQLEKNHPALAPHSLAWFDTESALFQDAHAAYSRAASDTAYVKELRESGAVLERERISLLAPITRPGKIICIGLNYRDHAAESNMPIPESPIIFSKFATCVIGPGQAVQLPPHSSETDYEAELAVVIGRRAKFVARDTAYDYVLGYANFNDVSARDFQFADKQWVRGKSCDTFAPLGEFIVTKDEIADPHRLSIKLHLNKRTMQDSTTAQLIFGIPELIEFLTQSITLEPGDVIATGTPPGVGFAQKPPVYLKAGDVMEVEIEGLGILRNTVEAVGGR